MTVGLDFMRLGSERMRLGGNTYILEGCLGLVKKF